MCQITMIMEAEVKYSEEEMAAIKKAIKVAKKLDICIELVISKHGVDKYWETMLVKPTDSYERVIRRWSIKNA